eukprot:Gb_12877 [translate_table: standard]
MMLSPVQVCMDSTDWPQTMMQERAFRPTSDDLLSCSRPMLERRLKPQPEQALKCPRCDSTNTKFCYYNNYSLSQPRHFCKTCRRYWTRGGALRTVPVGGGCRKNKRAKRTAAEQPANFAQNEPSTSTASGSSGLVTNGTPLDQSHLNHGNPSSDVYYNLPTNGSNDINLAFARVQQSAPFGDQSGLTNCNGSDFLGLSCGSTQSSFGPQSSLNSLTPISSGISSLSNLSALNRFHSSLVDFPVIASNRTDQGAIGTSEWQVPASESLFEPAAGDSASNYWTGGPWSDLTSYGSSISPSL